MTPRELAMVALRKQGWTFKQIGVVLRVRRGLPWLRTPKTYRVLERAFRAGKEKRGFALVQYSVQRDHLHLLVETESKHELARGITRHILERMGRSKHHSDAGGMPGIRLESASGESR